MGQAGLHIPAFDHSELSVFDEVFADIGDEQSIEQILEYLLFPYDQYRLYFERGRPTVPSCSSMSWVPVLTRPREQRSPSPSCHDLHSRGIRTMATTHYSELKVFALTTPGVENGCCEFNVETLRPTYRLLIGVPGKSNAFAISGKLGLPDYIIEDARSRISEQDESFEDLLTRPGAQPRHH